MKIGILGSGDVGQAIGHGFIELEHEVMIGSRDPRSEKLMAWLGKHGSRARTGLFQEATKFGELLVLATKWDDGATENALTLAGLAGKENLNGKIVIDVTNPLDFSKKTPALSMGFMNSAGEEVQRWLPECKVVKAFNMVGSSHMFKPKFEEGEPNMFICGSDDEAKKKVSEILKDFGWPAIDLGDITISRLLEPLAMIWVTYGMKTNSWNHAFKLLKK